MRAGRAAAMAVGAMLALGMLAYPAEAVQAARDGLSLFASNALPSLLPFFIAAQLLTRSGAARLLARPLRPLWRALRLPDAAGGVLLASLICGYPSGARQTADLAASGQLTPQQTLRLAALASHPGPLFTLGAVAPQLGPGGQTIALALLLCCALGSLAAGLCTGVPKTHAAAQDPPPDAPSLLAILPEALRDGCLAMLPVAGAVCFFRVATALLGACGALRFLASLCAPLTGASIAQALPHIALELVSGSAAAARSEGPLQLRALLACAALAWGGLSVQMQCLSFLGRGVPAGRLIMLKAVQTGAAMAALLVLWPFLPLRQTVFAPLPPSAAATYPLGALLACTLLLGVWMSQRSAGGAGGRRRSPVGRVPS